METISQALIRDLLHVIHAMQRTNTVKHTMKFLDIEVNITIRRK